MSSTDEPPLRPARGADKSEFFFPGSGASALLIHGLSGTPYEMRYLGEQLAAAGIRVRGVRLAGHAGDPEELGEADYDNWYESVVQGFEDLRQYGDPNVVIGLSAGALLGARLALDQREAVAGVVMLAPAFFLPRAVTLALTVVAKLGPLASQLYLRNPSGSDIHDAAAKRIHPSAQLLPLSAPISMLALSRLLRPLLRRMTQPLLVIHSRRDHTCPMKRNVGYVMKHAGSAQKRAVILDESFHVITVDSEKERVAAEVGGFVEQFRAHPQQRASRGG
jgi:carboxylesterase